MSEMRLKTSHVFGKISDVFHKTSEKIWKTSDVFLSFIEGMKTKLHCLSSTPRKQERKVVNQQILK